MTTAKRIFSVFLLALLLILPGCSSAETVTCYAKAESPAPSSTAKPTPAVNTIELTVRVIDASTDSLLLADANSSSVYRNTLPDGKTYPAGTLLKLTCANEVLAIYPEQLAEIYGAEPIEDGFDDRCALYLQVLEDLWEEDQALQANIDYIGIDLSQTALTKSEQDAVAWHFGELKQKEVLTATFDELCEEGYIDRESLYWENGCLLSIVENDPPDKAFDLRRVNFRAEKWRSGLGAILFTECTAEQDASGHWSEYTCGGFAIA